MNWWRRRPSRCSLQAFIYKGSNDRIILGYPRFSWFKMNFCKQAKTYSELLGIFSYSEQIAE